MNLNKTANPANIYTYHLLRPCTKRRTTKMDSWPRDAVTRMPAALVSDAIKPIFNFWASIMHGFCTGSVTSDGNDEILKLDHMQLEPTSQPIHSHRIYTSKV